MSKIGNVDDLLHFEAVIFEHSAQRIREYEHRKVTDVLTCVHSRTAVVHAHGMGAGRHRELLLFFAECVEEIERSALAHRRRLTTEETREERHITAILFA